MKTLIMLRGGDRGEVRLFSVKDESDAKYQFRRRMEKEYWVADEAYLVDEANKLPCEKWVEEYDKEQSKILHEMAEARERASYERLKNKYEGQK